MLVVISCHSVVDILVLVHGLRNQQSIAPIWRLKQQQ